MRSWAWALALALALGGCGDAAGDDARAGMAAVTPTEASWRVWYLAPPWEVVERDAARVVLRVPNTANALVPGGTAGGLVGLVAAEAPGDDAAGFVAARVAEASAVGARVVVAPRALTYGGAATRVTEATVETRDGTRRIGALRVGAGRLLVLEFFSPRPLGDDGDVAQMLASVEPGAGGAP